MANKQISNLYQAQSPAIASYDWTDIASGSGFVEFDLYTAIHDDDKDDTTEVKNIVSENALYSADTFTRVDRTYETSFFNLPKRIKGSAIVAFSQGTVSNDGSDNSSAWVTVTIQKEDTQSVTTDLGSGTGDKVHSQDNSDPSVIVQVLKIDLTETTIKKGEKLKIKLEITKDGATSNNKTEIYTDPTNTSATFDGSEEVSLTRFVVNIPFKIDL